MNSITVPEGGNTGDKTEVTNDVEKTITTNTYSQQIKAKNIVLVLDLSTSMNKETSEKIYVGDWYGRPQYKNATRLDLAKDAIRDFVENIYAEGSGEDVEIRLVTFNWGSEEQFIDSGYYNWGQDLSMVGAKFYTAINSTNYQQRLNSIDSIKVPENMSTDITAGIDKARNELNNFTNKNNDNVVIFLGDGKPDKYTGDTKWDANNAATLLKDSATLYTIGFGMDSEGEGLLRDMASRDEETKKKLFYSANDRDSLINSFDAISSEVGKEPDVDYKTSADGIVTINLSNTLAADQKITIRINI